MNNDIQRSTQTDEQQGEAVEQQPRRTYEPVRTIGVSLLVLAIIVLTLVVASRSLNPQLTDPIQFVTGNLVNALVFIAIVAQVLIYRKQRDIMQQQREAMLAQLEKMNRQQHSVEQQILLFGIQAEAMVAQWNILSESLEETRNIVAQNERAVIAGEQSVVVAREAFYVGEAPYFGTSKIEFRWARNGPRTPAGALTVTRQPELIIAFMNGGKTPAWHFSAIPHLELGEFGEVERKWITLNVIHDNECPDAENTFYPSGTERRIKYQGRGEFSPTEIEAINARTQTLFLIIDIGYTDMRDDRKTRSFLRCFNPTTRGFGDCGGRQD